MISSHHKLGAAFLVACIVAGVALSAKTTSDRATEAAIRIDLRTLSYSDFRAKVAEGLVADVTPNEAMIVGHFKNGDEFNTVPIPHDTSLQELLSANGVRVNKTK